MYKAIIKHGLCKLSVAKSAIRSCPTSHCLYKRYVTQRLSKHGCRDGITRLRLVNPEGEATNQKPWLLKTACHAARVEARLPRWDYSASPREPRRGGYKPKSPGSLQRHVMQSLSKHGCRIGITRLRLVNPGGAAATQKALAR